MRLIAEFGKEREARYISHLDLMRVMQRSLRRAGVPVAYSQGFSPHPILSFATAVPVGCASRCEVADIRMAGDMPPDAFLAAINPALPDGMAVFRAMAAADEAPAPMAIVEAAEYLIEFYDDPRGAIAAFAAREAVPVAKKTKKGMREVDIRPMVYEMEALGARSLRCLLRHDNAQALKPTLLAQALGLEAASVLRTRLLARDGDGQKPLYDAYEGWRA